jgi:prepilin-type N-terminal cleavage/methylation domain-containing protein
MRRTQRGFTLVEAMLAIVLTALAASVLLVGSTVSLNTADDGQDQTAALGMAQQLMDEVLGNRYMEDGSDPWSTALGPGSGEANGVRSLFDDIDDFNGWRSQPPKDYRGIPLGQDDGQGGVRNQNFQTPAGQFDRWRQEIDVYYVSETDLNSRLAAGQTSDYRAVDVRIMRDNPPGGSQQLAKVRRVVAYVPPLP